MYMNFLRWLGGVVIIIWLLGFLLKMGGGVIHILLVVAVVAFVLDFIFGRKRL